MSAWPECKCGAPVQMHSPQERAKCDRWRVVEGDCLEAMRQMADSSVDAVVTDPPYGLGDCSPAKVEACLRAWLGGDGYEAAGGGFMGRAWDAWVPGPDVWREALRVLKPGGHLLAFSGARTVDLMGMALRLAGFEVRDCLQWVYASGFPKSLDVSKAIDKAAGAEREVVAPIAAPCAIRQGAAVAMRAGWQEAPMLTAPHTDDAKRWQGWGTALKPAAEPILLCRKPLEGTVAANVLAWRTGGVNVDGCRTQAPDAPDVAHVSHPAAPRFQGVMNGGRVSAAGESRVTSASVAGRWPANLLLTHAPGCEGDRNGSGCVEGCAVGEMGRQSGAAGQRGELTGGEPAPMRGDSGTAARFFPTFRYEPKAARVEREAGASLKGGADLRNPHETVKPVDLMRWLVRLVTPPGGLVLDPFNGSGTTGCAAMVEGMRYIGCEMDPAHAALARERIAWWEEHGARSVEAWKARRRTEDEADPRQGDLFGAAS